MGNAYRTIDGTDNNPLDPDLGQAKDQLLRAVESDYGDDISTLAGGDRPSPREISNAIFSQSESKPSEKGFSDFLWIWGQFLDHDITLSKESEVEGEEAPIPVPADDALFDPTGSGTVTIDFTRSEFDPATGTDATNPRQQLNDITPYIDASNVYGSDPVRQAALRDTDGRMKVSDGDLMPFNEDGQPNAMSTDATFFLGGDERANENIVLSSMHSLFLREHNRLVTEFEKEHPEWEPETLYQEARRIVEAQMQAITYNEFLPKLIGEGALDAYAGYDWNVDPAIANIFSTAAYRLGHTMLSSTIHRVDEDGSENAFGNLSLLDAFFQPQRLIDEGGVDALLRGAATSEAESVDHQIVDDVRNFLFGQPGTGGLDLASLNIQRGRDHGLDDYNGARQAYGLDPVTSFADITSDVALQAKLEAVFGTVDNVDVFVGALAEDPVPGSMLGLLFHVALVDQFTRLRDGDAFWYEARLSDEEIAMINGTTLSDIIERNTGIETMQDDVFTAMQRSAGTDAADVLIAGEEAFLLLGMDGNDDMMASAVSGEMHGGAGADRLFGFTADDWLVGGADADQLHGEGGADVLAGGIGNDFLTAGADNDHLDGGQGNDYMVTGMGMDRVTFSQGQDVVEDFDVTKDVIDFSSFPGVASKDDLTITTFETGSLLSDAKGNTLWLTGVTNPGDIAMEFGATRATYTGADKDVVAGSAGDDTIINGQGTQYVFAHHGQDTFKVDGNRADFTIAKTLDGSGYVIWNETEFDILWDMERVEFADEVVDLDAIV